LIVSKLEGVTTLRECIEKEVFTKIRKIHDSTGWTIFTRIHTCPIRVQIGVKEPLLYFPYLRGTVGPHVPRRTKERERNEGRRKGRYERRRKNAIHDVGVDPGYI